MFPYKIIVIQVPVNYARLRVNVKNTYDYISSQARYFTDFYLVFEHIVKKVTANSPCESLVGDIPAGDGKIANLFLQCSCCGSWSESVSARIGIILPNSDPDLYPLQPNEKINFTFSRKFQYAVQNTENYGTYDTDEKEKTMLTGTAVNKSFKNSDFPLSD